MTEQVQMILHQYFRSIAQCSDADEAHARSALLLAELSAAGVPDEILAGFRATLPDFVGLVVETRKRQDHLEGEIGKLRASSARKLGKATRCMPDISSDNGDLQLWVDDTVSMLLPEGAPPPPIGATVEYALGAEGDAVYYGSHGYDPTGLVRARLKSVERPENGGRPLVEVVLRDAGDDSDIAVTMVSDELLAILDDLEPNAPLRVTDGRPRIAYTGPACDEETSQIDRMLTPVTPIPEDEDNFIYAPAVVAKMSQIVQVFGDEIEAAKFGVHPVRSICYAGPTGVGKTTIAENKLGRDLVALGFQVFSVNSDQITSFWYGASEKNLTAALSAGGDLPTAIIFDELDSALPKRGASGDGVSSDVGDRLFSAFARIIAEKRELGEAPRLFVFTTNFYHRLDPAIRSRIDEVIDVPLPIPEVAAQIIQTYLERVVIEGDATEMAQAAVATLDLPFVRVVFESSNAERVYNASEVLSGRAIKQAVQSAAREAYFDGKRPVTTLNVIQHLKGQLHGNLSDLGRDDLAVALGVPSQDISRVTSIHVYEEVVQTDHFTRRENRLRFRVVA